MEEAQLYERISRKANCLQWIKTEDCDNTDIILSFCKKHWGSVIEHNGCLLLRNKVGYYSGKLDVGDWIVVRENGEWTTYSDEEFKTKYRRESK